jgi:aerobic-type carbon monoxide dehydrogenase small subunit (CoxS/CutS family)
MTAKALLDEKPAATEEDIRENLHGNICRCTGYVKIVEAVEAARDRMKKRDI